MRIWFLYTALFSMAMAGAAGAQTCSTTAYSYPLVNGATASAPQVMADLDCAPIHGLANWAGNVGIGTTAPSAGLDIEGSTQGHGLRIGNSGGNYGFLYDDGNFHIQNSASWLWINTGDTSSPVAINNQSNGNVILTNGVGFVGVGTTNPTSALTVQSAGNSGAAYLTVLPQNLTQSINIGFNHLWEAGTNGNNSMFLDSQGGGVLALQSLGGTGNVGVGTQTPQATLYVNGSAGGTSAWTNASDARLKKDIVEIPDALSLLTRLRGVRFNWRAADQREVGKSLKLPLDQPQIGFIAQEVETVVPEAVTVPKKGGDEIYSLEETKIIPILVEAVKQQQGEITSLRTEVADLKARLSAQARSSPATAPAP